MEGPPFVNHSKFQEGFWVAPVIGVSGVATTGRIWAESQKIHLVIGRMRTGNLAIISDNILAHLWRPWTSTSTASSQGSFSSWTGRAEQQHGACCMAGCSLGSSTGTLAEVVYSLMPAPTLDARASWPPSAMSCSPVQPPRLAPFTACWKDRYCYYVSG